MNLRKASCCPKKRISSVDADICETVTTSTDAQWIGGLLSPSARKATRSTSKRSILDTLYS